jgi:hypothetical protein
MRLVVCRQDRTKLLTRHGVFLCGKRQQCPNGPTTFDRVQAH